VCAVTSYRFVVRTSTAVHALTRDRGTRETRGRAWDVRYNWIKGPGLSIVVPAALTARRNGGRMRRGTVWAAVLGLGFDHARSGGVNRSSQTGKVPRRSDLMLSLYFHSESYTRTHIRAPAHAYLTCFLRPIRKTCVWIARGFDHNLTNRIWFISKRAFKKEKKRKLIKKISPAN